MSPDTRALGTCAQSGAVFDAMCDGAGSLATVEEPEDLVAFSIKDLEDLVAVSIESLEGFAILDGGATKTVSGSTRVQPVTDQYEETTVETTGVGFTFAGGETAAGSTDIWIPHSKFPQGILMNVVSSESTTFLIGLDVIREYDLVIDHHFKGVYSHIMKRYLPCAILSCSGDDAEQKATLDSVQRRVLPLDSALEPT